MKSLTQRTAELALVYTIPDLTNAKEHSRLAGLQRKLQKVVKKSLDKMPALSSLEKLRAINIIRDWGKTTGWLYSSKHVSILASFCVSMLEESKYKYDPKILQVLTDIVIHLENGKDFPTQYADAGAQASEKWLEYFRED